MLLPGGNNGWDLNSDPCPFNFTNGWYGVACVDPCYTPIDGEDCRFGRITGIQMPFNTMLGSIPNNVFSKLNNLTIFDVSHNSLSGTLPTQVGKLRNMMCAARSSHRSGVLGVAPPVLRAASVRRACGERAASVRSACGAFVLRSKRLTVDALFAPGTRNR
eukprot:3752332-Prymnesium_polylepis.1